MQCSITNGARRAALEIGIDLEILASRHVGKVLTVEDVQRAHRNSLKRSRTPHVLSYGTVATWPSIGSLPGQHRVSEPCDEQSFCKGKRSKMAGAMSGTPKICQDTTVKRMRKSNEMETALSSLRGAPDRAKCKVDAALRALRAADTCGDFKAEVSSDIT